jgi:hypothetical protein
MDKHVFAAALLLDEAEAFLAVEELHGAFAGADYLCGHAVEAAATAATATTAARAAKAPAAATIAATEAVTTAPMPVAAAITVTTAEPVSTAIISEIGRGRESVTAAAKWIKTVFAESVALVLAAPTSPVVSHNFSRTLPRCPISKALVT